MGGESAAASAADGRGHKWIARAAFAGVVLAYFLYAFMLYELASIIF